MYLLKQLKYNNLLILHVHVLPILAHKVPINGKVGNQVICPHSRCFGSYFDVVFLMYLVSSGFSFKPTSSSSIILINPV